MQNNIKTNLIIFILSFLIIFKINFYNNKNKKQKLILYLGNNCYHIHHWLLLIILLYFMYMIRFIHIKYFEAITIIFLAFILEGLLFKDRFKFFHKLCINM